MKGWRELICAGLQQRFPGTVFGFVNAGIGSTGSVPGAFRFSRDVLGRGPVDLLFVDAAVNDETNGTAAADQIRGLEGIVRHARRANPAMDIVLVHLADPAKIKQFHSGQVSGVIRTHERVAERYALPSVNVAKEVADRIKAGEFTWEKDFKGVHPAPFGHGIYAQAITRLLDAAWPAPSQPARAIVPHNLPAPLDRDNFSAGRLAGVEKAERDESWTLHQQWRPKDGTTTRRGFVDIPVLDATIVGAKLRYPFKGTAIGLFVLSGPDAGLIEWRIDDGKFQTVDLHTQWSKSVHLPWVVLLNPQLPNGEHVLEIRVAGAKNSGSSGHAVRIVHFLVNEP
jgi:sialidase-1